LGVDAEQAAPAGQGAQRGFDPVRPHAVEAHAVDDGLIRGQAEQAGALVALLGERRDGADLDVAEAERVQRRHGRGVLVKAGGKTDRAGKAQAQRGGGEHRVGRRGVAGHPQPQRQQREMMGGFRVDPAQQRHQGRDQARRHGPVVT
jgi:hypothetical protein